VLNIAGNIAGVCKGNTETLEAAVDSGTGLVQHHLLDRYLENLEGQGNWDYQKGFEYANRGVKSISMFLDKTGLKDQLADKLKDLGVEIGPAFSDLFEQQNTGCARELVKQLNPLTVNDLVPSGGGAAVNTISNAGSNVANMIPIIGLVAQVLNLGVSCVTLYKVHHLQAAVANIDQKMGAGFEDVMDMQGRWGGELKDLMRQGFEEILEKIREQNEESLLTAADKIRSLVYTDWQIEFTGVASNWGPNFRIVYGVCKQFLRALAKHLRKGDQTDVENKEIVVWLLQMTMNSAWLCLGYAQRLQFNEASTNQLLWGIYDELSIMLGRLVLHQQLETVESLLLSEQLNALCRLVVGDGVVRCPPQRANKRAPQPSLTITTAPSPQLLVQQQQPPPRPPLRPPPPPPQDLTNDSPAQRWYLDAHKWFHQNKELTTGQGGKPKEEGACGAGVVTPLALEISSDKIVHSPAGSAVRLAEKWQEWVAAQQESLLQTLLSDATHLDEAQMQRSIYQAISHGYSTRTESLCRGAEVVAARCCVDSEGEGGGMNLAFALRRMSALQGYENAQYNLGVMYEKGQGVQKDEKKAIAWFEKAAEQGNKDALNKLWVREDERMRG
jgi:hypothetical protein